MMTPTLTRKKAVTSPQTSGGSRLVRALSRVAPDWWDYTTLDPNLLRDAARLTPRDIEQLARPGFKIRFYETREEFYLAEAMEYVSSWRQATASRPSGICGPIGPTEQLPLVARLVNDLDISLKHCHFWGMDEWILEDGKEADIDYPLGFARADLDLCFNRIRKELAMPRENLHFPSVSGLKEYTQSFQDFRCIVMQGGQGETKHWAFNDPVRREGKYKNHPPSPDEFRKLSARVVELHPMTVIQNARTSGGGMVSSIPSKAITVGPVETWNSEKVSIWLNGVHDNSFGARLTALMISKRLPDSSVPMSLLADHPHVQFNFLRPALTSCEVEMH